MVFRKRVFRKRGFRKRGFRKRGFRKARFTKALSTANNHTYKFTRWAFNYSNISSDTGASQVGSFQFNLSQVPNSSEFTALYDQYRITGIKVKFLPQFNVAQAAASGFQGIFYTTLDFDDDDISALSESTICQTRYCRTHILPNGGKPIKRYFVPRNRQLVIQDFTTALNPATMGQTKFGKNAWIDCANANVQYYGLKWVWTTSSIDQLVILPRVKFYLEFRNPR